MQELEPKGFLYLVVFELNGWVVNVIVRVLFAEDTECLFMTFFGNKPTWRLRNKPQERKLNNGRKPLSDGWDWP